MREIVLVLNYDHVTSRAVARILRAERIDCKILPGDTPAAQVFACRPQGIILSGGPGNGMPFDEKILEAGTPILALGGMACAVAKALGGEIQEACICNELSTIRWADHPLFHGLDETERMMKLVMGWDLPPILVPVMQSQHVCAGFAHMARPFYGLQMQLEQNAPEDSRILRNFAVDICGCETAWSEESFISSTVEEMRSTVGEGRALCCVTGGLDSALSAVLAKRALGEKLQCVFVDAGFLREGESKRFLALCEEQLGLNVHTVKAHDRFMQAMQGLGDREEKRCAFQQTMHDILAECARELGAFAYFVKGTNCGDKLFSDGPSEKLAPEGLMVIEPLQDLFKQEIRQVAASAGMPRDLVDQQPFPGGGLAQRIVGPVDQDKLDVLRYADHVFSSELRQSGAAKRLYQYYALMLPPRDAYSGCTIVLRAAQSGEGTVAPAARLPYDVMESVTEQILREKPRVSHVVYDMTPGNYYSDVEW